MRPMLHRSPRFELILALAPFLAWGLEAFAQEGVNPSTPKSPSPVPAAAATPAAAAPGEKTDAGAEAGAADAGTEAAKEGQEPGKAKSPAQGQQPVPEISPEERARLWHEKTPPSLARKLHVGAGLGLGTGKGPDSGYSSDRIGAQVFAQFPVAALTPGKADFLMEGQYAAITGVDTDKDESQSVQYLLVGGGLDWRLGSGAASGETVNVSTLSPGASERMRFQGLLLAGLTKRDALVQDTGNRPGSKFGASVALEGRYLHLLSDRVEAFAGLGARVVGYSWVDLKFGVVAGF
jgi:hypothetical protein